jgi:hypothetical protein
MSVVSFPADEQEMRSDAGPSAEGPGIPPTAVLALVVGLVAGLFAYGQSRGASPQPPRAVAPGESATADAGRPDGGWEAAALAAGIWDAGAAEEARL